MTHTPNPTAEQILTDEWILQADRAKAMTGMDAIWFPDAGETLAALRAHNLLSEGALSEERRGINLMRDLGFDESDPEVVKARADAAFEEQVERARLEIHRVMASEWAVIASALKMDQGQYDSLLSDLARAALSAAGVAPQEPPALDPVKVAEVLNRHEPIFKDGLYAGRCICGFEHPSYSGWRLHRSGALCEAAKRGELS